MFDPNSRFKKQYSAASGLQEVRLEEDDPDAISLVLGIAHLHFKKIPAFLDYRQLLNLAVVCDKYDVVALVRPWYSKWEEHLSTLACDPYFEEWLFIAWTFGDTKVYTRLMKTLIVEVTSDSEGRCYRSGKLLGSKMPPNSLSEYTKTSVS